MSRNKVFYVDPEVRKWTGLYKIQMSKIVNKYLINDLSSIIVDYIY